MCTYPFFPNETDPVLIKYKDDIKDFGYISRGIGTNQRSGAKTYLADLSNIVSKSAD